MAMTEENIYATSITVNADSRLSKNTKGSRKNLLDKLHESLVVPSGGTTSAMSQGRKLEKSGSKAKKGNDYVKI